MMPSSGGTRGLPSKNCYKCSGYRGGAKKYQKLNAVMSPNIPFMDSKSLDVFILNSQARYESLSERRQRDFMNIVD
ncbi:hypothetical protein D5086_020749 [Populus alba]|uniref:Uncharacterized protein n=1 Tax=Populus alba TaxID=43335 RepID=A0ACC4BKX8_POPAL